MGRSSKPGICGLKLPNFASETPKILAIRAFSQNSNDLWPCWLAMSLWVSDWSGRTSQRWDCGMSGMLSRQSFLLHSSLVPWKLCEIRPQMLWLRVHFAGLWSLEPETSPQCWSTGKTWKDDLQSRTANLVSWICVDMSWVTAASKPLCQGH